ncbi:hypothetical protein LJB90_02425 [Eubacteriales bacterium OttesenSCG-928-G02]|nr:hypothetical protein [Eubacteriales bacterium OttesenSCG-928-G02]
MRIKLTLLIAAFILTIFVLQACTNDDTESKNSTSVPEESVTASADESNVSDELSSDELAEIKKFFNGGSTTRYMNASLNLSGMETQLIVAEDNGNVYSKTTYINNDQTYSELYITNDNGTFLIMEDKKQYIAAENPENNFPVKFDFDDTQVSFVNKFDMDLIEIKIITNYDTYPNIAVYFNENLPYAIVYYLSVDSINVEVTMMIDEFSYTIPDNIYFELPADYTELTPEYPENFPPFEAGVFTDFKKDEDNIMYYTYTNVLQSDYEAYTSILKLSGFNKYIYEEQEGENTIFEACTAEGARVFLIYNDGDFSIIYYPVYDIKPKLPGNVPLPSSGKIVYYSKYADNEYTYYSINYIDSTLDQISSYMDTLISKGFDISNKGDSVYTGENKKGDRVEFYLTQYEENEILMKIMFYFK